MKFVAYKYDKRIGAYLGSETVEPFQSHDRLIYELPPHSTLVEPPLPEKGKVAVWLDTRTVGSWFRTTAANAAGSIGREKKSPFCAWAIRPTGICTGVQMYQPKNDRPRTPTAILLWMGVCVVLIGLIVIILQGCAAGPQSAPLSRLAGANPNCIKNCSASLLTIENNRPGAARSVR